MTVRGVSSTSRRLALGLTVLAVSAAGLAGVATNAFFTDTKTVTANTFTAGTVTLTATPATSALTFTAMAPGDKVVAPITVTNTGSLAQRYAVTSVTTGSSVFAAQLDLTVKTGVTSCTSGGFGTDGVVVYAAGDLGATTPGIKTIGDKAVGAQGGDRNLAAGANEVLCAQVQLPTTTDNTFQALTTTAVFTFDAEQTINNP